MIKQQRRRQTRFPETFREHCAARRQAGNPVRLRKAARHRPGRFASVSPRTLKARLPDEISHQYAASARSGGLESIAKRRDRLGLRARSFGPRLGGRDLCEIGRRQCAAGPDASGICVQSAAITPICAASAPIAVSIAPSASVGRERASIRSPPCAPSSMGSPQSDPRPGAPVDAERRPPQAAPFVGDDIEHRIRRGVIRLPRRAQQGRGR